MRVIHDTEFPNSVDATQKLLDEQGAEYERLKVRVCLCVDRIILSYEYQKFQRLNISCVLFIEFSRRKF